MIADSAKTCSYWRKQPHVFHSATWGPKYCSLCMDENVVSPPNHLEPASLPDEDPRHYTPSKNRPVEQLETWWKVHGWNDAPKGGSCIYAGHRHYETALAQARLLAEDGDHEGRVFDHYLVEEMVFMRVCTTYHHPVTAKQ